MAGGSGGARVLAKIVVVALVVASGLVLGTPAAAAATKCSGYAGCDVAPYTNHGYDATTNHRSYWGQYVGDNCTNYVAYLLVTLDGMPDRQPWKGSGDADNWGRAEAAITDRKPAVGAIAWWPAGFHGAGSLGHVARVESVASASTIVVSEDAFPEDGMTDYSGNAYDWRVITKKSRRWPSGFIHFVATG